MARPSTALIVDDEDHVRVYLRMLLTQLGVETVWECSSEPSAIALYQEHQPQVVLLDVIIPGSSGQIIFKKLTDIDPDVAVIVVSSQNASRIVQEMHQLGAVTYLLKHTPREQMLKMLGEALDWVAGEE